MASKLQNLERLEGIAKAKDATLKIDREPGTGQWTVAVDWSNGNVGGWCRGRAKTLEAALADAVAQGQLLNL